MFFSASFIRSITGGVLGLIALTALAQETYELPKVSVYSPQVANQTPVATFAMPVSGLQFEPRVDVQSRNFAEAQADVSIRGGLFENTGFKFGAVAIFDPQTGHYFAELPVAPAMLTAPQVLTGAANATGGFNAEVGTVAYQWRAIRTTGELALAAGDYGTNRQSFYHGYAGPTDSSGNSLAADVDLSRSESDGSVPFGDHDFKRVTGRVQWRGANHQTDLIAGHQEKFFGWPNLYTPFGFYETESLETDLYAFNHRAWTSAASYWEVGAYYRRNYDDYEFNRPVPGASNPFQHTTHVRSLAFDGHFGEGDWGVGYGGQYLADAIQSTALTFGHFRTRDYAKLSVVPEYTVDSSGGRATFRAGLTYDDTNRDASALSPVVEVAWADKQGWRAYGQYAESTQVATYTALNSSATSGLFRGNPDLQREVSRNLEAGVEFKPAGWTVQAAAFYRWDDELVDWTFRRGVTARTANPVDIGTAGFETVAVFNAKQVDLVFGYTFLNKTSDYGTAVVDASFYALNFAKHRFTAAVVARLGAEWELRVDNEYRVQEENFLRTIGGDRAWLTGAGLYYTPRQWRGLELSVRVDNAWDSDFQEVPAVPAGRRQYVFGAAYRW